MIYELLYEKFLINNRYAASKENAVFSTFLILSSEIGLNLSAGMFCFLDINKAYFEVFAFAMLFAALCVFIFFKKSKLNTLIEKRKESKKIFKVIVIIYSVLTYIFFLAAVSNLPPLP